MAEGSWIRITAVQAGLDAKTINSILEDAVSDQMQSITQAPEVRKQIGEAFLKAVTPFVPVKSGALRDSGRATDDGRLYWTAVAPAWKDEEEGGYAFNYASTVYDQDKVRWAEGETYAKPSKNKNATPRWVEQVKPETPEHDVFLNEVREILIKAHRGGLL